MSSGTYEGSLKQAMYDTFLREEGDIDKAWKLYNEFDRQWRMLAKQAYKDLVNGKLEEILTDVFFKIRNGDIERGWEVYDEFKTQFNEILKEE